MLLLPVMAIFSWHSPAIRVHGLGGAITNDGQREQVCSRSYRLATSALHCPCRSIIGPRHWIWGTWTRTYRISVEVPDDELRCTCVQGPEGVWRAVRGVDVPRRVAFTIATALI
jgi:hypothetical protein